LLSGIDSKATEISLVIGIPLSSHETANAGQCEPQELSAKATNRSSEIAARLSLGTPAAERHDWN
jgi:hypothetical protein